MSEPQQQPERRLPPAEEQRQQAAASRETNRPADSTPVVAGQFAKLPAAFGRYQVEKLLGRGAMGAVYLARDTQLDRLVALKIPKVAASGSKRLLLRLETEAKAAAKLDHPSLCKVFDAGEVGGQCFIAMQYIEGETLKTQLESKSKSVEESVALIVQLAEGLSEAHAQGIIHRDLKPENIMINRRGTPVIMDFGLAKFSGISSNAVATQAGTILGSPAYMSPEQASGNLKEIDQRSDIYSLGTIFFELLTGAWPFSGSAMQILGQKSIQDPASPLSLKPDLPPQVATICHKMIARSNVDRYHTLVDLIEDLRMVTSSTAPAAVNTSAIESGPFPDFTGLEQSGGRSLSQVRRTLRNPTQEAGNSSIVPKHLRDLWNAQPPAMKWPLLFGTIVLLVFGVIIITIKNKDGTRAKIEVPDTSTVAVTSRTAKAKRPGGMKPPDPTTLPASDAKVDSVLNPTAVPVVYGIENANFAEGFKGWELEGGAKEFQVSDSGFLTTYGSKTKKEGTTGRVFQSFNVPPNADTLNFLFNGGAGKHTYVALNYDGKTYRRESARNTNTIHQVKWDIMPLRGKRVTLEVVDESTAGWGFIGVHKIEIVLGSDEGFKMPAGARVVEKGSFTAWTVPEDPAPGSDYKIIIQIKYRDASQKLLEGDISGSVTGSDTYRFEISPLNSGIIPKASQVVVNIPGAKAGVRDTIEVKSAILMESQRLEIVF